MVVRVTRLMEYEYGEVAQALDDMQRWQVPAHGVRAFSGPRSAPQPVIRSAVIGPVYGPAAEAIHTAIPLPEDAAPARICRSPGETEILGPITNEPGLATVVLFKPGGKYYTQEHWTIPDGAVGPWDMERSPDFHRITGGPVLVPSQEPWGYPFLLMKGA